MCLDPEASLHPPPLSPACAHNKGTSPQNTSWKTKSTLYVSKVQCKTTKNWWEIKFVHMYWLAWQWVSEISFSASLTGTTINFLTIFWISDFSCKVESTSWNCFSELECYFVGFEVCSPDVLSLHSCHGSLISPVCRAHFGLASHCCAYRKSVCHACMDMSIWGSHSRQWFDSSICPM